MKYQPVLKCYCNTFNSLLETAVSTVAKGHTGPIPMTGKRGR